MRTSFPGIRCAPAVREKTCSLRDAGTPAMTGFVVTEAPTLASGGTAEQESLGRVAPLRLQERELLLRFDAFGDDFESELMGHGDDRSHYATCAPFAGKVRDERSIDLHRVKGQPAKVAERRVSGAEIVHQQPDPALPERLERHVGPLEILHGHGLRDLEL